MKTKSRAQAHRLRKRLILLCVQSAIGGACISRPLIPVYWR